MLCEYVASNVLSTTSLCKYNLRFRDCQTHTFMCRIKWCIVSNDVHFSERMRLSYVYSIGAFASTDLHHLMRHMNVCVQKSSLKLHEMYHNNSYIMHCCCVFTIAWVYCWNTLNIYRSAHTNFQFYCSKITRKNHSANEDDPINCQCCFIAFWKKISV